MNNSSSNVDEQQGDEQPDDSSSSNHHGTLKDWELPGDVVAESFVKWVKCAPKIQYFQDRNCRWPFNTRKQGYTHLCKLTQVCERLLSMNMEQIQLKQHDIDAHVSEGVKIYAKKPAHASEGVTWSQDEYGHLGLQREYIRYKSIQRFTETWELLRRAHNCGMLKRLVMSGSDHNERIRVCSLGGGPGFELYALREFFKVHYPQLTVECVSLDLEPSWCMYAKAMNIHFEVWNTDDGDHVLEKAGGKIDVAIASYALHMYMSGENHIDWLSRLILSQDIPLMLVNSRMPHLSKHIGAMQDKGVACTKLIDQTNGEDDRQLVYHSKALVRSPTRPPIPTLYPNVPYEEHKFRGGPPRKRRNYGNGNRSSRKQRW